jgi:hypothetical protein
LARIKHACVHAHCLRLPPRTGAAVSHVVQLVLGCRPCPKGMITSTSLPNSAQWFVTDEASPPRQGFTDPLAW